MTVIVGLIVEPVPAAAVGFLGVTVGRRACRNVLFSPAQLAAPGFNANASAITWALSGFSNSTVWLIFSAFVFSLGYEKTGLGKRISLLLLSRLGGRTLTLGYAVMLADLALAPFMPSNTARSGGTIYPVIKNIPEFYQSLPNDPSSRRIGGFLMWTAIASTCVTSSMFLTGLAPNVLAVELVRKTVHLDLAWGSWFLAFLPVGLILLAITPALAYVLYPPELKTCPEVPAWARKELRGMGRLSGKEITLLALVVTGAGLVDLRHQPDGRDDGRAAGRRPAGGHPHRHLDQRAGRQARLQHADLVRHVGDPGGRAGHHRRRRLARRVRSARTSPRCRRWAG